MSTNLHYTIYGKGAPVIILHGLFGSSRNWLSIAKNLAEEYQVITPDLRNHGQSFPAESMTYTEMAMDVATLIRELSLEKVSLAGHSMGGKVAMVTALEYPDRINHLAVLDIAPVSYEHRYGKIFSALQNLPLNRIKNRNEAEQILNEQFDDLFLVRFLVQNLSRTDKGFEWRINLTAIQENIEHISSFPEPGDKSMFEKPALFLGGEYSQFIQPVHKEPVSRYFPKAEIEYIKNAGHMLHIEQPEAVLNRLKQFLQT